MTKQYMTAFPGFDNGDTFDALLAALEPMGFFDSSYKNDVSAEDQYDGVSNDTNKDFTSVADALTYIRMHYMELEQGTTEWLETYHPEIAGLLEELEL